MERYILERNGNKVVLKDTVLNNTYYGELYIESNGKEYVKSRNYLSMQLISKFIRGLLK